MSQGLGRGPRGGEGCCREATRRGQHLRRVAGPERVRVPNLGRSRQRRRRRLVRADKRIRLRYLRPERATEVLVPRLDPRLVEVRMRDEVRWRLRRGRVEVLHVDPEEENHLEGRHDLRDLRNEGHDEARLTGVAEGRRAVNARGFEAESCEAGSS